MPTLIGRVVPKGALAHTLYQANLAVAFFNLRHLLTMKRNNRHGAVFCQQIATIRHYLGQNC